MCSHLYRVQATNKLSNYPDQEWSIFVVRTLGVSVPLKSDAWTSGISNSSSSYSRSYSYLFISRSFICKFNPYF